MHSWGSGFGDEGFGDVRLKGWGLEQRVGNSGTKDWMLKRDYLGVRAAHFSTRLMGSGFRVLLFKFVYGLHSGPEGGGVRLRIISVGHLSTGDTKHEHKRVGCWIRVLPNLIQKHPEDS